MTLPEDPPRLLDEPGEGLGELKLGLERMSSNLPTAEQLGRMAVHLNVAPNGGAGNGVPRGSNTLLKIAAGAGISGAVLWALLHGTNPAPELDQRGASRSAPSSTSLVEGAPPLATNAPPPTSRAPISAASRAQPAASRAEPNADAPLAQPLPAAEPKPTLRPTDSSVPGSKAPRATPTATSKPSRSAPASATGASAATEARGVSPAPAKPPVVAAPSEMELLRDARLALSGDPARALALTEQHRREYPSGGFSQEREVIAITALARLGRTAEARSRAERFRAAFPTSPYIERLNKTVPP